MQEAQLVTERATLQESQLWYKDAIIYEVHVRAFADSNGDGIGDFRGLTRKLDYLQDLGVSAVWLLPFYPSPLRDDGYDIADYANINPIYGSLADFKVFLRAAHRRGLRVITELVLNHTSDRHPWFQRARQRLPALRSATSTCGAIAPTGIATLALFSRTSRLPTGLGTRSPMLISGIASFTISRTLTLTTPKSRSALRNTGFLARNGD